MQGASSKRDRFQFRLDLHSGVPIYRQIIDQVTGGIATGALAPGDQLPTVRQLAVDLTVNPNTIVRAYRELEIRGVLETQQGTGTFIAAQKPRRDDAERRRQLDRMLDDLVARAGAAGFTVAEVIEGLQEIQTGDGQDAPRSRSTPEKARTEKKDQRR